ncbi:MAG: ABC transporter permease [Deltaproteobacteria bacterium]|nr:ABC transporter permease [Deltaproteobacteria bacterium]
MLLRLAWRNIWRNPRRTGVILTAVVVGVWTMVLLGALMRGMLTGMVANGIATLTGDIQIHARGFHADPSVQHTLADPAPALAELARLAPPGAAWASRVRVPGIVMNARHTRGVTLVGIQPEKEARVSFYGGAVTEGRGLLPADPLGVVVGRALLDRLQTKLGRKLVIMSQEAGGGMASRAFRIVGVFQAEMEGTEKQFVFISLDQAQQMLNLGHGISEIAVLLPQHQQHPPLAAALRQTLPPGLEVLTWLELLPMMQVFLQMFDFFNLLYYLVVFTAMAFGLVNTTLMAVYERMREFGLLKALGQKPWGIMRQVLAEAFMILAVGVVIGDGLAFATIAWLGQHGIDLSSLAAGVEFSGMTRIIRPELAAADVWLANGVVIILGLAVSFYPAAKAARFTPVEALGRV